jgi:hypothetical protein
MESTETYNLSPIKRKESSMQEEEKSMVREDKNSKENSNQSDQEQELSLTLDDFVETGRFEKSFQVL